MKNLDEKTAAHIKKTLESDTLKQWLEANPLKFKMMDARKTMEDIVNNHLVPEERDGKDSETT